MVSGEPNCVAACGMLKTSLPIEMHTLSSDLLRTLEEDLSKVVLSLRQEHNSRTFPGKLPPEVLLHVFRHAREVKDTLDDDSHLIIPPPDHKTLLSLTHVCRFWRSTAIASPALWSHVPRVPVKISSLFLQRAGKKVPLTIHIIGLSFPWWREDPRKPTLSLRVRALIIDTSHSDMAGYTAKNSLRPVAPHLRYLAITSPIREYRYSDPPAITSTTLFGGAAPALTAFALTLRSGVLYADSFPALAHLRIAGSEHIVLPALSLLAMLEHTPALETLYVRNTTMRHPKQALPLPTVRLDRLRAGSIDTQSVDAACALVQALRIPATGTLQLHLLKVLSKAALALPSTLGEALGPLAALEVIAGSSFFHVRTRRPEGGGLWLEFYAKDGGGVREQVLAPLVRALGPALADVRTLRVSAYWTHYRDGLLATVLKTAGPHITALDALVVATPNHTWAEGAEGLRGALAPRREGDGEGEDVVPLPALTTIGVESQGCDGRFYEPFVDVLRQRAARGHRLERVVLHGSRAWQTTEQEQQAAAEVEGLVGTVEYAKRAVWDVECDPAWRTMNEHWVLFPRADEENCHWAWGGLFPGKHR
ncbi:uncharacterized protein TRAVEDRAFT_54172 [Trametes versicolor FP-101664 SS1]|uniref:F-box domain-containing protein n=1 Tax=Trametes versicolor (strain FP-101664) TaxID=717944 RepID=R7S7T5_TRAVS|nr:uncharacterized protein TRAVEDRAFT_54172 [Trametes versicolor FP-101664 SS1]EIW51745.1 hypothetical protein TRAVEDRAFT_54172 [Trametes versicolor FP-101664 SS1]